MHHILRRLALLLTLFAASMLHGQDGTEVTAAEKAFFREFKRAVLAGDSAWVIAHVSYPVRATIDGRARMIANAEELAVAYPSIMTLDTVNAVRRQSAESLVRTRQGTMVGDGEIWLGEDPAAPEGSEPKICIVAFGNSG